MFRKIGLSIFGVLACATGVLAGQKALPVHTVALSAALPAEHANDTWMLHLPGISGRRWIDDQMTLGLRDAGFTGAMDVYDWTGADPGLQSLRAYKRNQAEAQKVADFIADRYHKQPTLRIIVTGHSGGTGIVVWALERLPDDVKVDCVILLASALSPDYDLTKALSHVRGKFYSFCSENDILVLGTGTKLFGTIDGKKTEAAGECGFCMPRNADATQYDKLIQKPYEKAWMKYDNVGDHMGCMLRGFSEHIIAPLITGGANVPEKQQPAGPAPATVEKPMPIAERPTHS